MPSLLEQLPALGFDLAELFCATQQTVQKRLKGLSEYTAPEQDGLTIEEAYYLGNVGIHVTYHDHIVGELMIRGRHCGQDICARDLRLWAGLGEASEMLGPTSSIWRLVDVDDREVFAHSSLLPLWRPKFEELLAKNIDEFESTLGQAFTRHDWLGYANPTSRVDLHARFSRADGRLNRLAVNLPLGLSVPSRKEEVFEWAGIPTGSAELEAGGLTYKVVLVPHGLELRAFVTPWSSPLPETSTIVTGRSRDTDVTLPEAVALAEAKLAKRFSTPSPTPFSAVVDPERTSETEEYFLFQSILAGEREQQDWLPQTYNPEVGGLDDGPGFTCSTKPMPAVRVNKATGRCRWASLGDLVRHQYERVRDRMSLAFRNS